MLDLDIVSGFQEETQGLLIELTTLVEKLEESVGGSFPTQELNDFAQRIDRIMGAAKTLAQMDESDLGLPAIGGLAEVGKITGYQAAKLAIPALVPIFSAFCVDTLEVLGELTAAVGKPERAHEVLGEVYPTVKRRLDWLQAKVKELGVENSEEIGQGAIDEIMKRMGGLG